MTQVTAVLREPELLHGLDARRQQLPDRDDAEQDRQPEDDSNQCIDIRRKTQPHHRPQSDRQSAAGSRHQQGDQCFVKGQSETQDSRADQCAAEVWQNDVDQRLPGRRTKIGRSLDHAWSQCLEADDNGAVGQGLNKDRMPDNQRDERA